MWKKIKAWFKSLFGKKQECKCECKCENHINYVEVETLNNEDLVDTENLIDIKEVKVIDTVKEHNVNNDLTTQENPEKDNKVEESKEIITKIEDKQFFNDKSLKKYVVNKKIKEIGPSAFYGCTNLQEITLKSSTVVKLGKQAFDCRINRKLTIIPNLVIYVPEKLVNKYKEDLSWKRYADLIKPLKK